MAQVEQGLPSECEALSSKPYMAIKKERDYIIYKSTKTGNAKS
jgi:hypothetical protein